MIGVAIFRHINWSIAACALALVILGLIFIYSGCYQLTPDARTSYVLRQIAWAAIGMLVAAFFVMLDYRKLATIASFIYAFFIALLTAVLLTSDPRRGAQSWFSIGTFAVQPSEFAKVALILALARYLSRGDVSRKSPSYLAGALLLALFPVLLILKQPDLGSAIVFIPVLIAMLVAARMNWVYLFYVMITGVLSLPLGWRFLKPYQQARIRVFLNPQLDPLKSGYSAIQSMIAVGSGGVWGQGWLHGTQTHLRFLPERHTDFIFCVLGEETGFLGCLLVVILYAIIAFNGLRIAEQSRDEFGRLVAVGVTVLLASHVAINIGMTIGLLPITGLPLPLMSYGGSSLVSTLICLGILQSICARRYIF